MAQRLMLERSNERKEHRTVPLNTTGQSLLSGNVFCGHCGGRLVLTTNGTVTRRADGTPIQRKRIRYVCYNKTRRRQECSGQTGYTMHILDGMITEILHQVFDKMKAISGEQVVGLALQQQMNDLQAELNKAKAENSKANREYESLKAELLKALQDKSDLPRDVLSEMLEETRNKVLDSSKRVTELTLLLEQKNGIIENMKAEYDRIASWSEIFDQSDMAVKKTICSYIIAAVILPDGFLFGTDNAKINIKKKLLGEFNLHTIIRMPSSVFSPYTSITTNILFFDRTSPTQETWYYRLDMPEGYKHFSKTKPMQLEHFAPAIEWWSNRQELCIDGFDKAKKYTAQQLVEEFGYNLDLCGYPRQEEIILEPLDLIKQYEEERASLNAEIDRTLAEIVAILGGSAK